MKAPFKIPDCMLLTANFPAQRIGEGEPVRRAAALLTGGARPHPG